MEADEAVAVLCDHTSLFSIMRGSPFSVSVVQ